MPIPRNWSGELVFEWLALQGYLTEVGVPIGAGTPDGRLEADYHLHANVKIRIPRLSRFYAVALLVRRIKADGKNNSRNHPRKEGRHLEKLLRREVGVSLGKLRYRLASNFP